MANLVELKSGDTYDMDDIGLSFHGTRLEAIQLVLPGGAQISPRIDSVRSLTLTPECTHRVEYLDYTKSVGDGFEASVVFGKITHMDDVDTIGTLHGQPFSVPFDQVARIEMGEDRVGDIQCRRLNEAAPSRRHRTDRMAGYPEPSDTLR